MADYEREVIQSVCHSVQWVQNIFEVTAETSKVSIIWLCLALRTMPLDISIIQLPLASWPIEMTSRDITTWSEFKIYQDIPQTFV